MNTSETASRASFWMAEYARDFVLKSYCDGDESQRFCFLRVPDSADRNAPSALILDASISYQVLSRMFSLASVSHSLSSVIAPCISCTWPVRHIIGAEDAS
jgi:hypothetical protein